MPKTAKPRIGSNAHYQDVEADTEGTGGRAGDVAQ